MKAKQNNQVRRLMSRWQKYELIAPDEAGYVPLADIGAEFLFRVISERAAIVVTTNLPFSEWTMVFPNLRLCKALLDRVTKRASGSRRRLSRGRWHACRKLLQSLDLGLGMGLDTGRMAETAEPS